MEVSAAVDERFAPDRIAIGGGRAECAVAPAAVKTSARDPVFSSADECTTRPGGFAERFIATLRTAAALSNASEARRSIAIGPATSGADPVNIVGRSTVHVAGGRSEVAPEAASVSTLGARPFIDGVRLHARAALPVVNDGVAPPDAIAAAAVAAFVAAEAAAARPIVVAGRVGDAVAR
eukprot:1007702-Prymnesium_polylepis.1